MLGTTSKDMHLNVPGETQDFNFQLKPDKIVKDQE